MDYTGAELLECAPVLVHFSADSAETLVSGMAMPDDTDQNALGPICHRSRNSGESVCDVDIGMSKSEFIDEPSIDPYGRFLRMSDVESAVGIRKSKIYELMKDDSDPFPQPIHIGTRSVWIEREVVAWKAKRIIKARQR